MQFAKRFGWGLLVLAIVLIAALPLPDFWITQLNYIALYSLACLGLVLLTGVAGLTSFGQAAFVGMGAYATAWLTLNTGLSPWLALFIALSVTGVSALIVAGITLRMSGHYLPLATIAWGLSLYYLMGNLDALGKYDGLLDIPGLSIFGWEVGQGRGFFLLAWSVLLLAALALLQLLDSRAGRAMRSLRTGTQMAEAMGVNTLRYKVIIFVIAALLAFGLAVCALPALHQPLALRPEDGHRVPVHDGGRRRGPCLGCRHRSALDQAAGRPAAGVAAPAHRHQRQL